MCAVSMVADDYRKTGLPNWVTSIPMTLMPPNLTVPSMNPTRAEFDKLKAEVEELKLKLLEAKQEDIANGEPDCEMESKIDFLRTLGEYLGVNLNEVFKDEPST